MGQVTKVVEVSNLDLAEERVGELNGDFSEKGGGRLWQLKNFKGVITAYTSGKIVIQGKDEGWVGDVCELLGGDSKNPTEVHDFTPHIGVDEAGKGDYFGPLVTAAVFVDGPKSRDKLLEIGVRDSKKISDKKAIDLREKILEICKHTTEVVISPEKYNELYKKFNNVNKMLAWAHARSIENLLKDAGVKKSCENVVIDQFAKSESRVLDALMENGRQLKITQKHGGESDIAVAAASIVARGRFLLELEKLGEKYDTKFPKGASQVIEFGKNFLNRHGIEELKNVTKYSFKTTLKITSTFDI